MSNIVYDKRPFKTRVNDVLANDFKVKAIQTAQDVFYEKRKAVVDQVAEWEDFRNESADLRDHVLANLDYYLNQFAENAEKAGAHVHFAADDKEATAICMEVLRAKEAKMVVKSKTMVSEEIGLNHELIEVGIEVNETDLAEFILQTADFDPPSHIVVPALHFERNRIRDTFAKKLGYEGTENPEEMTRFVRRYIRDRFLRADVGFTGCNFGVAETGTITIVSNEGNGRMASSMPKTQIALMGASQRVMQLAFVPIWGMSQGLQPAVGTNYGAKNYTRVKQLTNIFIIGSTVLSGILFAVIELFPNQILSAFITESDIVESGISLYRLMFCAFFTYGLLIMTLTYFQALGRAKLAGFIVVFRQLVLVVPMVLLLPVLMRGNVLGVWLALPLNDIVILFIAVILLMREYRLLRKMQSELVLDTM